MIIHTSDAKAQGLEAFRMCDRLYFVGSKKVSVHLIDTQEGLVLIDTGYPDMYALIVDNIRAMGFDPRDICAIFHTHGHIDHFGCTQRLKEISGAKTYISRVDNDIVNGKLDLSGAKELNMERLPFFDCDVLIEDGDVFSFGDIRIRCVLTPGHTEGVLSFFVTIGEGENKIIAAMHGGVGFNSMKADFLDRYGLSHDCRKQFLEGLHRLKDEHVDLVLGNHPGQTGTQEKLDKIRLGADSILDATQWKRFLETTESRFQAFFQEEAQ